MILSRGEAGQCEREHYPVRNLGSSVQHLWGHRVIKIADPPSALHFFTVAHRRLGLLAVDNAGVHAGRNGHSGAANRTVGE
jgi:hypothetical protein